MKRIIITQTYTITTVHYADGSMNITRCNDGYSVLELIGLLSVAITDLTKYFKKQGNPQGVRIKRVSTNSPITNKEAK
jgi:hypothetical protein